MERGGTDLAMRPNHASQPNTAPHNTAQQRNANRQNRTKGARPSPAKQLNTNAQKHTAEKTIENQNYRELSRSDCVVDGGVAIIERENGRVGWVFFVGCASPRSVGGGVNVFSSFSFFFSSSFS